MSTICKSICSAHNPTVICAYLSTLRKTHFNTKQPTQQPANVHSFWAFNYSANYTANVATVLPIDNTDSTTIISSN